MPERFNCVLQLRVGSKTAVRLFERAVQLPVRPNIGDSVEWMSGRRRCIEQVVLVDQAETLLAICKGDYRAYRQPDLHAKICQKLLDNGWREIQQAPETEE